MLDMIPAQDFLPIKLPGMTYAREFQMSSDGSQEDGFFSPIYLG